MSQGQTDVQASETLAESARFGKELASKYRKLLDTVSFADSTQQLMAAKSVVNDSVMQSNVSLNMSQPHIDDSMGNSILNTSQLSGTRSIQQGMMLPPTSATRVEGTQRFYTHEFVEQLQQKHKETLQRATETSEQIINDKDALIRKLKNRIREMDTEALAREKEAAEELQSSRREVAALSAEIAKAREEEVLAAQRVIGELRASHRDKLLSVKSEYENSLNQMREWAKSEVATMQAAKDAAIEELEKEIDRLKKNNNDRVIGTSTANQSEIEDLRLSLARACEQASSLEQELNEAKLELKQTKMQYESKLQDVRSEAESYQKQLEVQMQRMEASQDSASAILSQRLKQQQQMYQHEKSALEAKIIELTTRLNESEGLRQQQIAAAADDIRVLNDHFVHGQDIVKALEAENKRLSKECAEATEAREIMEEELIVLRNEVRVQRQTNESLKAEIERLDKIMTTRKLDGDASVAASSIVAPATSG